MHPEVGAFEAFYSSAVQHPIALWIAAGAALLYCASLRDLPTNMRRYCFALAGLSIADAWLTTNDIFLLGPLPAALQSGVPLFFVLAGDYRFLLVVFAGTATGDLAISRKALLVAGAVTAVVPLFSQVVLALVPETMGGGRVLYLVYEVAFAALTLALLQWHPNARRPGWIRRVGAFVVLYYSLWAIADGIILATGSDLGYLLRVLPNLLYYGGLIAVMGLTAAANSRHTT